MILNAARRGLGCGGFGYSRLGPEEPSLERRKPWDVPKGHLAVNVEGGAGGDRRTVLVPVVYVNHPLFGDLLREAEKVYGYEHDGGIITLPCGISELARVHDRIAAGEPQRQRKAVCCWTTNSNSNSKRRLLV
ncbi:hypothetical protein MLD38_038885 [Melastoma candidum]|nr:hypothetical protein MLD38_038885 [Melastoma candidum]